MAGKTRIRKIINLVFRLAVGGMFIYTGVTKILDPYGFMKSIENYKAVPVGIAIITAWYLPYLEVLAGILLILKKLYKGSLSIITGLLMLFQTLLISTIVRGIDISCGCTGGPAESSDVSTAIIRNIFLLGMTIWLLIEEYKKHRLRE